MRSGFAAVALAALLAVSVVGAPLSAAPGGSPIGAATATGVDAGVAAVQSGDDAGTVDPRLENATGTTEVVVRFEPADPRGLGPGGTPAERRQRATAALREHADTTQAPFDQFAAGTAGVGIQRDFWLANAKLVELDADRVDPERLARVENVEAVHVNFEVELLSAASGGPRSGAASASTLPTGAAATETASSRNHTYGLEMVGAPDVWAQYGQRGENATVAVLDTGVDNGSHPDLDPAGWAEFDDNGNQLDTEPNDGHGHGTHTSGTVVGNVTSDGTHYGVAPEADLLHGKVLNDDGSGTFSSVLAGMEWATNHSASPDAISMSLGASGYDDGYIEPVQNARAAGTVVVSSIGNDGEGTSSSPGNVYDVLSVGAVDEYEDVPSFSSGETIDTSDAWGSAAPSDWPDQYDAPHVSAPGVYVNSSVPGGGYEEKHGTSMAAPHVAGAVALVRAEHPNATAEDVQAALEVNAEHPAGGSKDTRYGYGIVNATAAVGDDAGGIEGAVVDAAVGDGVANVSLALVENGTTVNETETAADGRFEIAPIEPGSYELTASDQDFENATTAVEVEPFRVNATNLTLAPHPGSVAWNVTSAVTGAPLENASVALRNASGGTVNETVANGTSDGRFDPVDRDREYALSVERTDYRRSNGTVDVGPNESVVRNVTLAPEPGTIEGLVTDRNGTPVEGASVALASGAAGPVSTDANGSYALSGVPTEAEQTLVVDARAYHENRSVNRTLAANGSAVANATIAQRARYFGVDDFSAPDSVGEGEEFTVEATISNLGADDWNRTVVFDVNGAGAGSAEVALNATENETVSFTHAIDEGGTTNTVAIAANESPSAKVYVEPSGGGFFAPPSDSDGDTEPEGEPDVSVVGAAVRVATVGVGETVPVDVTAWNTGTGDGAIDLTLTADGTAVAEASVDVAATERVEKRLSATIEEPGTYDLAVNGEDAGSVVVERAAPAENAADDAEEPPGDGMPGFGPLAALLALLAGGSMASRRRAGD